jgi:hypothetical protein
VRERTAPQVYDHRGILVLPRGAGSGGELSEAGAAAAEAEDAARRARLVRAALEAHRLLVRHSHSAVALGGMAVVYGGLVGRLPSDALIGVRHADLSTTALEVDGTSPGARYGHAAAPCLSGMLLCGGVGERGMIDDAYLLETKPLRWSRLRLPTSSIPTPLPARALNADAALVAQSLRRSHHGVASIDSLEGGCAAFVFGGYMDTVAKFGKVGAGCGGGFASHHSTFLWHTTPTAAALALAEDAKAVAWRQRHALPLMPVPASTPDVPVRDLGEDEGEDLVTHMEH